MFTFLRGIIQSGSDVLFRLNSVYFLYCNRFRVAVPDVDNFHTNGIGEVDIGLSGAHERLDVLDLGEGHSPIINVRLQDYYVSHITGREGFTGISAFRVFVAHLFYPHLS